MSNQSFISWVEGAYQYNDFLPLDRKMQERSDKKLDPFVDEILTAAIEARESVDRIIGHMREKSKFNPERLKKLQRYPIGECCFIRDKAMELIEGNLRNPDYPGCRAIRSYNKTKDAVFKQIWGIQNNNNFQNAIQIGDWCIDVALDTIDEPQPKVQVKRIYECGIKNIESFEEYSRIAEKYWGWEIYPNIYLPHLAPLIPMIAIRKNGAIYLCMAQTGLMQKSILSGGGNLSRFQMSHDFIFESSYSGKELSDEYKIRLATLFNHFRSAHSGKYGFLEETEPDGCKIMTEAAFFQRDEMGGVEEYYVVVSNGIVKEFNKQGFLLKGKENTGI